MEGGQILGNSIDELQKLGNGAWVFAAKKVHGGRFPVLQPEEAWKALFEPYKNAELRRITYVKFKDGKALVSDSQVVSMPPKPEDSVRLPYRNVKWVLGLFLFRDGSVAQNESIK